MKKLSIGLFGFGCVGQGLYDVLSQSLHEIGTIKKICVKNKNKNRPIPMENFTFNKYDIINDPSIDTVVELINDYKEAYSIALEAIKNGKNVVTANKKMLAYHLKDLQEQAIKNNVSLLYEASACGSIPIIRLLEEYYDNEPLKYIGGIFNGTTNYILSNLGLENKDYQKALKEAQKKGYAESDPTIDVEAWDPAFKSIILAFHGFGMYLSANNFPRLGISQINFKDIEFASKNKWKIKLLSYITVSDNKYIAFVLPTMVDKTSPLFDTNFEYNGVITEGKFTSQQFLKGKGAGGHPTGSAVLSDLSALRYGYKYEFKKLNPNNTFTPNYDAQFRIYLRCLINSDLLDYFENNWEEKHFDKNNKWGIGFLTYKKIIDIIPLIQKEGGFLSIIGEPWSNVLNEKTDLFFAKFTNKDKVLIS